VIVQQRGGQYVCITQPDHAKLAWTLMSAWASGGLPGHPRREAILAATRDHDNGWLEEDERLHVSDSGDPLDFITVPAEVKQRIWPRAAARAAKTSPYVGALVAQHALTVHAPCRQDAGWSVFFHEMERVRDALLAAASPEERLALDDDYPFVRAGDQLSLIYCNGWTAPMSGIGYRAILRGATLEIAPDPFGGRRVPIRVEARAVPARRYASAADLREVLDRAAPQLLEGVAAGA
jgi:hypothetical protein